LKKEKKPETLVHLNINQKKNCPNRIILWLRNDLRLHDNYALDWAVNQARSTNSEIIPVYCFDPRYFNVASAKTKYNKIKT
jgi:deoxyribodipyrimidine photolyase